MDVREARAILGVRDGASLSELRAAHRSRAQLLHPDKHSSASQSVVDAATAAMQQLNAALDTLTAAHRGAGPGVSSRETGWPDGPATHHATFGSDTLVCLLCGWEQVVRNTDAAYACTRCNARLRRATCDVCGVALTLWGTGAWRCPRCGSGVPGADAPSTGAVPSSNYGCLMILAVVALLILYLILR